MDRGRGKRGRRSEEETRKQGGKIYDPERDGEKEKEDRRSLKELSLEMLLAASHPFYSSHRFQWVVCCPHQGSCCPCTFLFLLLLKFIGVTTVDKLT